MIVWYVPFHRFLIGRKKSSPYLSPMNSPASPTWGCFVFASKFVIYLAYLPPGFFQVSFEVRQIQEHLYFQTSHHKPGTISLERRNRVWKNISCVLRFLHDEMIQNWKDPWFDIVTWKPTGSLRPSLLFPSRSWSDSISLKLEAILSHAVTSTK